MAPLRAVRRPHPAMMVPGATAARAVFGATSNDRAGRPSAGLTEREGKEQNQRVLGPFST